MYVWLRDSLSVELEQLNPAQASRVQTSFIVTVCTNIEEIRGFILSYVGSGDLPSVASIWALPG